MIFGESTTIEAPISPSKYELGIKGALMHVYENECNFNAIMKSAALSEMRYYNETGGDLFIQEAKAKSGLFAKIKAFFQKVIEKIKSIFEKFIDKLKQFKTNAADFVKKYKKKLTDKSIPSFEFEGYPYNMNGDWDNIKMENNIEKLYNGLTLEKVDDDELNSIKEKNRGNIVGEDELTTSEFSKKLTEILCGEKTNLTIDSAALLDSLKNLENSKMIISKIDKAKSEAINSINNSIKELNDLEKTLKDTTSTNNNSYMQKIDVLKSYANDLTVMFGAEAKAASDMCKQSKSICIKALSKYETKNESAIGNDIFAGVQIV